MNNYSYDSSQYCKFFMSGKCIKADSCKYLHNISLAEPYIDFVNAYKTMKREELINIIYYDLLVHNCALILAPCYNFHVFGDCKDDDDCVFYHSYEHGLMLQAKNYYDYYLPLFIKEN